MTEPTELNKFNLLIIDPQVDFCEGGEVSRKRCNR